MRHPRIAGAGLAGLIAAHAWPQAELFEAQPEPRESHKALLRFRSQSVAQLVGIEFREVLVRKGIWEGGRFIAPSIQVANHYSAKILGSIEADRSIWNLDPVKRYIAPETFYDELVESVGKRIHWGQAWSYAPSSRVERAPVISTAPLPDVLQAVGIKHNIEFRRAPIQVARFRVPKCAVYQTVYFPDPQQPVYRASITGDLLIIEHVASDYEGKPRDLGTLELNDVMEAFGIYSLGDSIGKTEQRYGKIVPLPAEPRRALLGRLTTEHGIYSLGRFATWRNLLLDDVVDDLAVIRKLLRASEYEQRLHFASS